MPYAFPYLWFDIYMFVVLLVYVHTGPGGGWVCLGPRMEQGRLPITDKDYIRILTFSAYP